MRQPSLKYATKPRAKIGPEARLHLAVVQWLMIAGEPGMLFLHPANEGKRSAQSGAFLKRMGMRAGAADLLIFYKGRAFALELKAKGGKLSPAQYAFSDDWIYAGFSYDSADNIDDALQCLRDWGVIKPAKRAST